MNRRVHRGVSDADHHRAIASHAGTLAGRGADADDQLILLGLDRQFLGLERAARANPGDRRVTADLYVDAGAGSAAIGVVVEQAPPEVAGDAELLHLGIGLHCQRRVPVECQAAQHLASVCFDTLVVELCLKAAQWLGTPGALVGIGGGELDVVAHPGGRIQAVDHHRQRTGDGQFFRFAGGVGVAAGQFAGHIRQAVRVVLEVGIDRFQRTPAIQPIEVEQLLVLRRHADTPGGDVAAITDQRTGALVELAVHRSDAERGIGTVVLLDVGVDRAFRAVVHVALALQGLHRHIAVDLDHRLAGAATNDGFGLVIGNANGQCRRQAELAVGRFGGSRIGILAEQGLHLACQVIGDRLGRGDRLAGCVVGARLASLNAGAVALLVDQIDRRDVEVAPLAQIRIEGRSRGAVEQRQRNGRAAGGALADGFEFDFVVQRLLSQCLERNIVTNGEPRSIRYLGQSLDIAMCHAESKACGTALPTVAIFGVGGGGLQVQGVVTECLHVQIMAGIQGRTRLDIDQRGTADAPISHTQVERQLAVQTGNRTGAGVHQPSGFGTDIDIVGSLQHRRGSQGDISIGIGDGHGDVRQ